MDKLIELRSIRKSYRTESVETQALRGVDLDIAKGEYVALTGASGCGKSTLLNILGLLDPPSSGTHLFKGEDVSTMTFDERARLRNQHIGFVFQSFHLMPGISVAANVALPVRYSRPARVDGAARALELLDRVGLSHRAQHRPGQLSGGQQQRVAIARALIMQPSVLLLDEPTGNLDAETSESIMNLIDELNNQDTAIVLVTHEGSFARRASRQLVVCDGQIAGNA